MNIVVRSSSHLFVCLLCREREKEKKRADTSVQSAPALLSKQQQQETERLHREQEVQMKIHMRNLKVSARTVCNLASVLIHINASALVF